jgi:hypothetical protein
MSILVFTQTFGGAIFLALAQLIFSDGLIAGLKEHAPNIDPETVITAGATAVRHVISTADLPAVLSAYIVAINRVFYLGTGAAGGLFLFSLGMGWKSLKKEKDIITPPESSNSDPATAEKIV